MSALGLGDSARVGELNATNLNVPFTSTGAVVKNYVFADTGATVPPKGFFTIDSIAGDVALTLADGGVVGDVCEFLYAHSGGFTFVLTFSLRGSTHTATMGPASGQYFKLCWYKGANTAAGWVVIGRESSSLVGDAAVKDLPAFA